MEGNNDDDEEQISLITMLFGMGISSLASTVISLGEMLAPIERAPSMFDQRMRWNDIVHRHGGRRAAFTRHLRMQLESFNKLLNYLRPHLIVDEEMARRRGGAILPEICLYCTIRWLAGGSYSDISLYAGISPASFYRVVWKTMVAIIETPELAITFPSGEADCEEHAAGFSSKSFGAAIANCVGAIDGYLLGIVTPTMERVGNVQSYFSGHYKRQGVNVQACCDHLSRFTYIAVAAGPGQMADNIAVSQVDLKARIEALPNGYVVIGDAAYSPSEHLVSMYTCADTRKAKYDNFNFYASQIRIRIEMAFGMMAMKWGILQKPVCCDIGKVRILVQAIGRMHNFCINERLRLVDGCVDPVYEDGIVGRGTDEAIQQADAELQALSIEFPTWSIIRERMVKRIAELGLSRPART